jgi:shikimate dehydrogenase
MHRLGVLGWPVAHSRSPAIHNAALASLGMSDWRYQFLPVPPELVAQTAKALGPAGFVGANVTIPHKSAALALADSASPAAAAIGAANTLTFAEDGAIAATNTDAPGLIAAIAEPLQDKRALVLGAGGSARAAVWALRQAGAADVLIWNRTGERASALAHELGARAVACPEPADVLVNCTAVGLAPAGRAGAELEQLRLTQELIGRFTTVVDLVYGDGETDLLATARAAGTRIVEGLDVLVAQGALSFELWTGRQAPLKVMREAARAASRHAPAAARP